MKPHPGAATVSAAINSWMVGKQEADNAFLRSGLPVQLGGCSR